MGRLRPEQPGGPTSAYRRCHRPAPPLAALYWELIPGDDGEVVAVICEGCLTLREHAGDPGQEGARHPGA
jgi:hypothetical protein